MFEITSYSMLWTQDNVYIKNLWSGGLCCPNEIHKVLKPCMRLSFKESTLIGNGGYGYFNISYNFKVREKKWTLLNFEATFHHHLQKIIKSNIWNWSKLPTCREFDYQKSCTTIHSTHDIAGLECYTFLYWFVLILLSVWWAHLWRK